MIKNNTPRVIHNRINDVSAVAVTLQREQLPQHLPLVYIMGARGPEEPVVVGGSDLQRIYGAESFDVRKPFYKHQNILATVLNGAGNSMMTKRVYPLDDDGEMAKTSSMTLVATVSTTAEETDHYERDAKGMYTLDDVGEKIALEAKYQRPVKEITWSWMTKEDAVTADDASADVFSVVSFAASGRGKYGNSIGVSLWNGSADTARPSDSEVVEDQQSLLLQASIYEVTDAGTEVLIENLFGSTLTEFSLKENVFSRKTNVDLTMDRMVTKYSNDGLSSGTSPIYGPLGEAIIHQESVDKLLKMLMFAEMDARVEATLVDLGTTDSDVMVYDGTLADRDATEEGMIAYVDALKILEAKAVVTVGGTPVTSEYLIDMLTGKYANGAPYYGIRLKASNTVLLTEDSGPHMLMGGTDGGTTDAQFDAAVKLEIDTNYQNSAYSLIDRLHYPFSCVYDTGFDTETKYSLLKWLSYRPDVHVTLSPYQQSNTTPLTVSEEATAGVDLRSKADLYAESAVHGASVCRAIIMGHDGVLIGHPYKKRLPLTFQIAYMRALYMGAGDGKYRSGFAYDNGRTGGNHVRLMKDVSNPWMSETAKDYAWASGINFVQYVDRSTLFIPALQTVYRTITSTLASESTMLIAVDVTKKSESVWTKLSGDSRLTEPQFLAASNGIFLDSVEGAYDGRATVEVDTVVTPEDTERGYSWTLNAHIYTSPMRTVNTVNVLTHRR